MTAELPLAFLPSTDNVGRVVVSVLAVAGAAFLGGLTVGFVTNFLARSLTAKTVPRPALVFLRLLGAVVAGVLAAMVLFSSGGGSGWGWGGGGDGPGPGPGKGNGEQVNPDKKDKDAAKDQPPPKNGELDKSKALRIDVLIYPSQGQERPYRVEGDAQLKTRDEVARILDERRKEDPALERVVIVLYKKSPDRDTTIVRELERLIENKGLLPSFLLEPGQAPP